MNTYAVTILLDEQGHATNITKEVIGYSLADAIHIANGRMVELEDAAGGTARIVAIKEVFADLEQV